MRRFRALVLLASLGITLTGATALGQSVEVETGEIEGALYRIQIPPEWNGNLVMYAHGYKPPGAQWTPLADAHCAVFLNRGFALAESGYSRQGWAVEEALRETEALRQFFEKSHGKADSTFVAGHSMGGLITLATIEMYPEQYVGALPMCGPLVPAVHFFKDPVFDMLVTFEALFGDSMPQDLKPVIEVPNLTPVSVEEALASKPSLADEFAGRWKIRRNDLPGILALYHLLYRELAARAGGNPIDNWDTVYQGFSTVKNYNESVPRYSATREALEYTRKHYTPTGVIEDPVIAVHTTYDPGVPPSLPSYYDVTVSLRGKENMFVQKHVEADGHCNIAPELMGKAFDELRVWAATGLRASPGLIQ